MIQFHDGHAKKLHGAVSQDADSSHIGYPADINQSIPQQGLQLPQLCSFCNRKRDPDFMCLMSRNRFRDIFQHQQGFDRGIKRYATVTGIGSDNVVARPVLCQSALVQFTAGISVADDDDPLAIDATFTQPRKNTV